MPLTHFKNFFGPGALCFSDAAHDARTPIPEKVTCRDCLVLMGRAAWTPDDEDAAAERDVDTCFRRRV